MQVRVGSAKSQGIGPEGVAEVRKDLDREISKECPVCGDLAVMMIDRDFESVACPELD